MPPPNFTWSYSALNDFETCPAKYAAGRYYKTTVFKDTEATLWGKRVHTCAENILKGVPHNDPDVAPLVQSYCNVMLKSGGTIMVEKQIAIDTDFQPIDWFSKKAWGRGVVDVAIRKDDHIGIYDWKTGKMKDDETQLKIFCLFMALDNITAQSFSAKFIWLKDKKVSTGIELSRAEALSVLEDILPRVNRMKQAWDNELFQPKPSGLCRGWCDVVECVHRREKR